MLPQAGTYAELLSKFEWAVPEHYNIGVDVCDKWAEAEGGRPALIHKAQNGAVSQFTFEHIRRLSNQCANLLTRHGVQRGDRVGILLGQVPEAAVAHVAIYKLAAIAVPLFVLFGTEALRYRLANCAASVIITDSVGALKLDAIRAELPDLRLIFTIDGPCRGCHDFHAGMRAQRDDYAPVNTRADDPALIIYTSGTTGQPKGALHAHRTLLGHLPGVEMSHDLFPQPGDRIWTPADWAWIGGLLDVLMPAWHHGVTVIAHRFEKFDPEGAFQLMADFGVRNAFLPPTALKLMRTMERPIERWRYHLRSIASGGETLGAELLAWGRDAFGLTVNEFYGQTECNMIVSSCARLMPNRPGVMGRPVPGHEIAILDEAGLRLPDGVLGQIAVRRPDPVMFLEYWQNPRASADKFIGDWLLTGDMGTRDAEGAIRFVGRNDDVINSGGYRIGPSEIEDCLLGHPAVRLAAAIGVPDALRGEIVKAYIVLNPGYAPSATLIHDIQHHVRVRLAAHEYPREIAFVDSLPTTVTGKVMRRELRATHSPK